jgi:hypothetical protein
MTCRARSGNPSITLCNRPNSTLRTTVSGTSEEPSSATNSVRGGASSVVPDGRSRLSVSDAARLVAFTSGTVYPSLPADSSTVGSRPSSARNSWYVRPSLKILPLTLRGSLMTLDRSAAASWTALRIHHTA